jgi:uncharacterized protein (TIGR03000 family)
MYSVVLLMALSGGAETPAAHGCNGCNGCNGNSSCHGGRSRGHGCNGCDCGGGRSRGHRNHGCCGCNGGYNHGCCGCQGYNYSCCGAAPVCGCAGGQPVEQKKDAKDLPKGGKDESSIAAPATVVVNLPADAKLRVDDYLTTSTSTSRVFVSPALTPGQDFTYTLKAEIVRDGKTVVATKQITVRAGERTNVNIEFPVAVAAK